MKGVVHASIKKGIKSGNMANQREEVCSSISLLVRELMEYTFHNYLTLVIA